MNFHTRTARGQMIELANKLEDLLKGSSDDESPIIQNIILFLDNGDFKTAERITLVAVDHLRNQHPHIYKILQETLLKKKPPFK
ncbi:MAG: hypothetical protein A3I24_04070 [Candidatus Harrisonbacteria bacterium RIFCSPLOWO2_02_FULL_41_13b]|uniref:Uncharacterized protein n=1 Tax=Candidatus Harrisonbacteria bacterium RIFCSPLOWO2_02_FULL_41_13b TaxID=1798409 RepID=A0A1G1ZQ74_9BACT|nr:MAG: hypothetical protein A3J53_00280 [Candidatus Harrisonbacteria bacterium RIFCSPHIGHO2_02_FULL_40_20]OGY66838.1 MAG: hypothetical protein A3I24_04070 [Candidatus Harrisonbacteria bacterium RIFCSPLOWO2_02_FULL_41_13b]